MRKLWQGVVAVGVLAMASPGRADEYAGVDLSDGASKTMYHSQLSVNTQANYAKKNTEGKVNALTDFADRIAEDWKELYYGNTFDLKGLQDPPGIRELQNIISNAHESLSTARKKRDQVDISEEAKITAIIVDMLTKRYDVNKVRPLKTVVTESMHGLLESHGQYKLMNLIESVVQDFYNVNRGGQQARRMGMLVNGVNGHDVNFGAVVRPLGGALNPNPRQPLAKVTDQFLANLANAKNEYADYILELMGEETKKEAPNAVVDHRIIDASKVPLKTLVKGTLHAYVPRLYQTFAKPSFNSACRNNDLLGGHQEGKTEKTYVEYMANGKAKGKKGYH